MEWETVIGLEIHAQLATNSKIFSGASTQFEIIASNGHMLLLNFLLFATKLYSSSHILDCVMHHLSRKQLESFIENGAQSAISRYQRYIHGRENARVASIAFIGAGKRTHNKAVIRIISRVVWSERDDEKWMDLK